MTDRIDEIRAREQAANKGPWKVEYDHDDASDIPFPISLGPIGYIEHTGPRDCQDAEFIAHARDDIPWLLDRITQLTAELDQAKAENRELIRALGLNEEAAT